MTDFYVNPIVGFRTWRVSKNPLALKALSWHSYWPARAPAISTHVSVWRGPYPRSCDPGRPCDHCGIWAFHSYIGLESHSAPSKGPEEVRGLVAGWGPVHLCSRGWRAGKAYPLALFDWETPPHLIPNGIGWHYTMHRIAKRYGVPVISTVEEAHAVIENAGAVLAEEYVPLHPDVGLSGPQLGLIPPGGRMVWYDDPCNWRLEIGG